MKYKLILILMLTIFLIISIKIQLQQHKKIKELEQQIEKQIRSIEIDKRTMEQIESVNTGDIQHDFNAGIDQLYELSQKRRN